MVLELEWGSTDFLGTPMVQDYVLPNGGMGSVLVRE